MDGKSASKTRVLGLALEQYAGIQTALLHGFPLEQVLKNERFSAARWSRARAAWGNRLARDGHAGPLAAAFREKSAEAASWLGRRIEPLEDDLQAWCAFLGAYAAADAPGELLRRLGMRGTDVQRLIFTWKVRIDKEPALAKEAAEITASKPNRIPTVLVAEGKLRPFPWSPGPEPERATVVSSAAPEAAPAAVRDDATAPRVLEVPSFLKAAPILSPSAPATSVPEPCGPAPATPPKVGMGETVAAFSLPLPVAAALPFHTGAPSIPTASPAPAGHGAAAPPQGGGMSTGTALVFEIPRGPAVPFRSASGDSVTEEAKGPGPMGVSPKAASPQEGSSKSGSPQGSEASASAADPGPTGTALAFELPKRPDLPFSSAAARFDDPTRGDELAALARAIAARARGPSSPQATAPTAPLDGDPAASTPPAAAPTSPPLTLEQHASLCAEIAFRPDERASILARYRVTEATMQSLALRYQDRADRKTAWETAYRTYFEWLASRSRGRPKT